MKPTAYDESRCRNLLADIRKKAPLVHHITNWVTIYDCAQITRSAGALPVMAHMKEEVADMVSISGALVLNIGTLSADVVESMMTAGQAALRHGVPVVLDIVGCGATSARTQTVRELIDRIRPAVIKGNAGEIGAAAGAESEVKGVESISVSGDISQIAGELANSTASVCVVTGAEDIVTDGVRLHRCAAGHSMMGRVVGTGCMASSVIGTFVSVTGRHLDAAVCAMNFYGSCGERAAKTTDAPMAFKQALLDQVYRTAEFMAGES